MEQFGQNATVDEIVIDDELWMDLIELTDGEAALCYQCGVCTAVCPWGLVKREPLFVRTFMRFAQTGLPNPGEHMWLCTTCSQCEAYCPRGVNIVQVFRALRYIAWKQRIPFKGLPSLLWSIYWNNNPWSQPPSQRAQWATGLDIAPFDPDKHEILIYVGCTSSYDQRAQNIAISLVRLFNAAGVNFGYLGEEEPCCGESVLSVGHKPYFDEIAATTTDFFQEKGVTQLVTVSPHCFDVFKNHYPTRGEVFNSIHYTQYLVELLDEDRFELNFPVEKRVTFQDPCYLGRHNDEYNAPRRILREIPGLEIVEMEHNRVDGLCCGGGGGRMWLETPLGERFSDLRLVEARNTGAEILLTACPFCVVCLEDSSKAMKPDGLEILDVAEISAMALE